MSDTLIPIDGESVVADLIVPGHSTGLIVFAHGRGSSRFSPRNKYVAETLQHAGFATLLFDLLTPDEAIRQELVFDVDLLGDRLRTALAWVRNQPDCANLPIGLFGASTGAAAAMIVAARAPQEISAVVSRGGRPDLAMQHLPRVFAPTLFIVGGADEDVLLLNRTAARFLAGPHEIRVISGATHLFEEPGALEQVADAACSWFEAHLRAA